MLKQRARSLIIKDNQILLMFRNKYGRIYFSLPGGGQEEQDKSLEETAVRETLEETSIVAKVTELLQTSTDEKGELQSLFLCEYIEGDVNLGDDVEMAKMAVNPLNFYKPMWVNLESVKDLPIRPKRFQEFVKNYVAKLETQAE